MTSLPVSHVLGLLGIIMAVHIIMVMGVQCCGGGTFGGRCRFTMVEEECPYWDAMHVPLERYVGVFILYFFFFFCRIKLSNVRDE